jgi:hypothetical protein
MHDALFRFSVITALLAFGLDSALAGPPSSCAGKFIGTWSYSGGTTTVSANGLAYPHCAACVPVQTWTCQGNTYLFSNSGPPGQFSATLVDSTHMQGSGVIATRVGGGARATPSAPNKEAREAEQATLAPKTVPPPRQAAKQPVKPSASAQRQAAAEPQQPSPPPSNQQQSANCSDITGIGGGCGPTNCAPSSGIPSNVQQQIAQAQSYMQAAQTVKQSDPTNTGWSTAATLFRKAAAAFQAAGDLAQAQAAAEQAQTLETGLKIANAKATQPANQPSTAPPAPQQSQPAAAAKERRQPAYSSKTLPSLVLTTSTRRVPLTKLKIRLLPKPMWTSMPVLKLPANGYIVMRHSKPSAPATSGVQLATTLR